MKRAFYTRVFDLMVLKVLLITFLVFLPGCSVTTEDYREQTPQFDMADYFNGPLQAWGMFQDYKGKVIKRFEVQMQGTWQDNQGVLDEYFTYSDGTTQRRVWKLNKLAGNKYSGTAGDVVGEATGIAHGNTLRWNYVMALEVDGTVYHVHFDDWMYMIDHDTVINKSYMTKLGFPLGEVTLVFRRIRT